MTKCLTLCSYQLDINLKFLNLEYYGLVCLGSKAYSTQDETPSPQISGWSIHILPCPYQPELKHCKLRQTTQHITLRSLFYYKGGK